MVAQKQPPVNALLETTGAVLAAEDRRPYERAVEQAQAQLGGKEFEKALQEGRAMSMEQAIECALVGEHSMDESRKYDVEV